MNFLKSFLIMVKTLSIKIIFCVAFLLSTACERDSEEKTLLNHILNKNLIINNFMDNYYPAIINEDKNFDIRINFNDEYYQRYTTYVSLYKWNEILDYKRYVFYTYGLNDEFYHIEYDSNTNIETSSMVYNIYIKKINGVYKGLLVISNFRLNQKNKIYNNFHYRIISNLNHTNMNKLSNEYDLKAVDCKSIDIDSINIDFNFPVSSNEFYRNIVFYYKN